VQNPAPGRSHLQARQNNVSYDGDWADYFVNLAWGLLMYWTTKRIALLGLCATALIVNFQTANAASFQIVGGAPLSTAPTPLYGSSLPQNNVVNAPGAPPTGALVFDPTGPNLTADTPWVQGGQLFTQSSSGKVNITWIFLGSESGFNVTFHAPGIPDFTEGNQNNSAFSGGPPLQFGGVENLGTKLSVPSGLLQFSLTWPTGSLDNNTPQPGPASGLANMIFSYAEIQFDPTHEAFLSLTKSQTDWIVFALNDNGGPDDNHDDFIGGAFISTAEVCGECEAPPQTPIPAALPLFGSVLAGGLLLHRWRKRRIATVRADG